MPMLSLLICACALFDVQDSYVLWMRAGTIFDNKPPWETCRTDLPSRSGKRHTYSVKVEENGTSQLTLHDPGKPPDEFWLKNMFRSLNLRQGDVFPHYGQLYLVDSVYFDKRRPEELVQNLSKLTLKKLTVDDLPRLEPDFLVVSKSDDQNYRLVGWQSPLVPELEDAVAITGWTNEPNDQSVTVHLRRIEYFDLRKRPKATEYSIQLKEGAVFEVHGKKIRLEQVVPPRDLGNNRRLTGWISFKGVAED